MPIDRDITSAIRQAVLDAIGGVVIYPQQNQRAPRPTGPYASVELTGPIQAVGIDSRYAPDANGIRKQHGDRTTTARIQFYRGDALDKAETLRQALHQEGPLDKLGAAGVAVWGVEDVVDLSGLLDTSWEERGALDVLVGFGVEYSEDVGLIEHVVLRGTMQNAGGGVVVDRTHTVPVIAYEEIATGGGLSQGAGDLVAVYNLTPTGGAVAGGAATVS